MDALTFNSLVLTPDVAETGKLSEPFAVLYPGTFKRHDFPKGGIKVTAADLEHAVEVFNRVFVPLGGVPIDEDHAFAEGRRAPALGWIKELYVEGDKLMCRAEWTPEGASLVSSGAYRLFSPEFSTDWVDENGTSHGFTLLAGGATNRPFLKHGLTPVALSDRAKEYVAAEATRLTSLAGLEIATAQHAVFANGANTNYTITLTGDSANAAALTARIDQQLGRQARAFTAAPKDAAMAEPTVTAKQVEDLTTALSEVRSTVETLKAENVTLTERADAAETAAEATAKELATERLTAVLSQARREGRIDAKDETTVEFADLAEKIGLDGVKTILAKIPAETIPVSEQGHGRDRPITASDAPEGVDPESHALHLRAEEIAKEQGIDYVEAASIAFKEAAV